VRNEEIFLRTEPSTLSCADSCADTPPDTPTNPADAPDKSRLRLEIENTFFFVISETLYIAFYTL